MVVLYFLCKYFNIDLAVDASITIKFKVEIDEIYSIEKRRFSEV